MNVLVTGLGGFIGQHVKSVFEGEGHRIYTVPREVLLPGGKTLQEATEGADVIVNLAGENLMGRWTNEKMIEIVESRRVITRNLVKAVNASEKKPFLWINASAVGIYKPDVFCDEESVDLGDNFLAAVVKAWEKELNTLYQIRQVVLRFGIVIGRDGGVVRKLMPLVKSRIAVVLGNGRQEFPLIHVEDVARFMLYSLRHEEIRGIYNMVIPNAVNYRQFVHTLSIGRPPFVTFSVPRWLLWMVMGEAEGVLTSSAHVLPMRMMRSGYELKYRTLNEMVEGGKVH